MSDLDELLKQRVWHQESTRVDYAVLEALRTHIQQRDELWEFCKAFMRDQRVTGAEQIPDGYDAFVFIEGVGKLVGWHDELAAATLALQVAEKLAGEKPLECRRCEQPMWVDAEGAAHHGIYPSIDEDADDDHVADDDYDPTPWCSGCGSISRKGCHCGPRADND